MKINTMSEIRLDKVVINIGIGMNENAIENAKLLIKKLTNHDAGTTLSKRRDPELKLRKGQKIGAVATLRGPVALDLLKRTLDANNNTINSSSIARNSLNFGVKEYIYLSGVKYDPKIGILGMNINAAFSRGGKRVELRRRKPGVIKKSHREIGRDELLEYLKKELNVKLTEGS